MDAPEQLSFLPDDYLERKAQRRTNVICAILTGIVMAAICSAFSLTEKMDQRSQAEHAAVEQQYSEAARQIDQVQQMENKQQRMARQAELAASLLEKIPRSIILAEATNSLPNGVSLIDLNMSSQRKSAAPPPSTDPNKKDASAPAPEPIAYDVSLRMKGVAGNDVQVAEFIRRLSRVRIFKDVNLVISDELTQDDQKLRRFEVEMSLDPNVDADSLQNHSASNNSTAAVETSK
jgi:Tfp pilus assembly protein PilN